MATIGYVIVILGALSVSVNLMHLIDRLERPRRNQRRRQHPTSHFRMQSLLQSSHPFTNSPSASRLSKQRRY